MTDPTLGPVLVIDDSPDDLYLTRRLLERTEIRNPIVELTGGDEAVSFLEKGAWPVPCVAFVDLKMPGISGFEFLKWVKERPELQQLTLIVLSGSDEPQDRMKAEALGARTYLVKDPTLEVLTDALEPVDCVKRS